MANTVALPQIDIQELIKAIVPMVPGPYGPLVAIGATLLLQLISNSMNPGQAPTPSPSPIPVPGDDGKIMDELVKIVSTLQRIAVAVEAIKPVK